MAHTSAPQLVSRLAERFERLETEFRRAYWDVQVEATPEREKRRAEIELDLRRAKGDPAAFDAVNSALADEVHDPFVRRQLEVLRLSLTSNQMDDARRAEIVRLSTAIERDFASFRPEVSGRRVGDNEIEKILRTSDEEDQRREAWTASKKVGGVTGDRLRDLVRARNEVALELGFADYYGMALELQEIPEEWLFERLDELDTHTRDPFTAWKEELDSELRRRFGITEVMPWHYADPFFQTLPPDGRVDLEPLLEGTDPVELAAKTFKTWGVDLSGVLAASDLYPREMKCQHAFCLDVDRRGDVRILANVVPGELWTGIMLHESGHAAYDVSVHRRLPYLLRRPTHIFVTEAIAILAGRFVHDPRWLIDMAEAPEGRVDAVRDDLRRARATSSLQFARWGLVMTHFERELYSDPEGDLDARWWELVERFQLVSAPADPPTGAWASKIHLATAPVYYQNYLLGEMLASQLAATVRRDHGEGLHSSEAGVFISEKIFQVGSRLRWDALIKEATGMRLSADAFAAETRL